MCIEWQRERERVRQRSILVESHIFILFLGICRSLSLSIYLCLFHVALCEHKFVSNILCKSIQESVRLISFVWKSHVILTFIHSLNFVEWDILESVGSNGLKSYNFFPLKTQAHAHTHTHSAHSECNESNWKWKPNEHWIYSKVFAFIWVFSLKFIYRIVS